MQGLQDEFDFPYGIGAPSTRHHRGRQRFHKFMDARIDEYMAAEHGSPSRSVINTKLREAIRPGRFMRRRRGRSVWYYVGEAEEQNKISKLLAEEARKIRKHRGRSEEQCRTSVLGEEEEEEEEALLQQAEDDPDHIDNEDDDDDDDEESPAESSLDQSHQEDVSIFAAAVDPPSGENVRLNETQDHSDEIQDDDCDMKDVENKGGVAGVKEPDVKEASDVQRASSKKCALEEDDDDDDGGTTATLPTAPATDSSLSQDNDQDNQDGGENPSNQQQQQQQEQPSSTTPRNRVIDSLLPPELRLEGCHVESACLRLTGKSMIADLLCKCDSAHCQRSFHLSEFDALLIIACPWCRASRTNGATSAIHPEQGAAVATIVGADIAAAAVVAIATEVVTVETTTPTPEKKKQEVKKLPSIKVTTTTASRPKRGKAQLGRRSLPSARKFNKVDAPPPQGTPTTTTIVAPQGTTVVALPLRGTSSLSSLSCDLQESNTTNRGGGTIMMNKTILNKKKPAPVKKKLPLVPKQKKESPANSISDEAPLNQKKEPTVNEAPSPKGPVIKKEQPLKPPPPVTTTATEILVTMKQKKDPAKPKKSDTRKITAAKPSQKPAPAASKKKKLQDSPSSSSSNNKTKSNARKETAKPEVDASKKSQDSKADETTKPKASKPIVCTLVDMSEDDIGDNCIRLGRGQTNYNHAGNRKFREIIAARVDGYKACKKPQKTEIVNEVTQQILNEGMKFVCEKDGLWQPLTSVEDIRRKVAHRLRDHVEASRRAEQYKEYNPYDADPVPEPKRQHPGQWNSNNNNQFGPAAMGNHPQMMQQQHQRAMSQMAAARQPFPYQPNMLAATNFMARARFLADGTNLGFASANEALQNTIRAVEAIQQAEQRKKLPHSGYRQDNNNNNNNNMMANNNNNNNVNNNRAMPTDVQIPLKHNNFAANGTMSAVDGSMHVVGHHLRPPTGDTQHSGGPIKKKKGAGLSLLADVVMTEAPARGGPYAPQPPMRGGSMGETTTNVQAQRSFSFATAAEAAILRNIKMSSSSGREEATIIHVKAPASSEDSSSGSAKRRFGDSQAGGSSRSKRPRTTTWASNEGGSAGMPIPQNNISLSQACRRRRQNDEEGSTFEGRRKRKASSANHPDTISS